MLLVLILVVAIVAGALWAAVRGHYICALALVIMAGYELSAPALFLLGEENLAPQALLLFAEDASEESIASFLGGLPWFFAVFTVAYLLFGGFFKVGRAQGSYRPQDSQGSGTLLGFPVVLLVFGLISMWTGAGQTRSEDYGWDGLQTTEYSRFFAYGGLLLVVAAYLAIQKLTVRHVSHLVLILICVTPLVIELFLAGRRQVFAPSFFLALLVLLYGTAKHKLVWVAGATLTVAVVFAFQVGLRELALQSETTIGTEALSYALIAPQFTEFVAVGVSSHNAWQFFVDGSDRPTLGFHWFFQVLNAVPFIKLGDLLFPNYLETLNAKYHLVSPWGGLSTTADAAIGLGFWGLPIAALLLALFCRSAHEYVRIALRQGMPITLHTVHNLCLIATLLPKYRGGFGDAIQTALSFSMLFWAVALVGYLLFTWKPRPSETILDQQSRSIG